MRTLRARIVALGVGAAAAVLVLLAVPVIITLDQNASSEAEQSATTTAQGVADFISGSAQRSDIALLVDRVNGRGSDTPVTVALADGTLLGLDEPACRTGESLSPGAAVATTAAGVGATTSCVRPPLLTASTFAAAG